MKTSELTGAALDWAVAKCEGVKVEQIMGLSLWSSANWKQYSTNWAQGGPIIERTCASVFFDVKDASYAGHPDEPWFCEMDDMGGMWHGQTPLIAAMRCYVAYKLGDEVDVPQELT
jgi:hypothetical protein